jgi:hypothetical protein
MNDARVVAALQRRRQAERERLHVLDPRGVGVTPVSNPLPVGADSECRAHAW